MTKLGRDALTHVAISLLWLLSHLPFSWQLALGRAIGRLFMRVGKRRCRIADTNLALCYPGLHPEQRSALLQQHCEALGMGLFETAKAWWGSPAWIARYLETRGLEHVHQAQAAGRPVILLSGHFTAIELSLLVDIADARLTYRPHENPVLNSVIERNRQRRGKHTVPRADIRQMLRVLKDKGIVWIAPDQSYSGKTAISAPFFGIPADTTTLVGLLAKRSGAVVIPFTIYRQTPLRYRLQLSPPLPDFSNDDALSAATKVNQAIENMVSNAPEQYFWVHRRFKNNPEQYRNAG